MLQIWWAQNDFQSRSLLGKTENRMVEAGQIFEILKYLKPRDEWVGIINMSGDLWKYERRNLATRSGDKWCNGGVNHDNCNLSF